MLVLGTCIHNSPTTFPVIFPKRSTLDRNVIYIMIEVNIFTLYPVCTRHSYFTMACIEINLRHKVQIIHSSSWWNVIYIMIEVNIFPLCPVCTRHPDFTMACIEINLRHKVQIIHLSSSWPWFPSRSSVLIYIYMHSLYEFCYRKYIYIQRECHSILAKLHPIII